MEETEKVLPGWIILPLPVHDLKNSLLVLSICLARECEEELYHKVKQQKSRFFISVYEKYEDISWTFWK